MKPKKRHTKSRKRIRRAAIKITAPVLSICPKCKKPVKPHTVCKFCGNYNGRKAIDVRIKKGNKIKHAE